MNLTSYPKVIRSVEMPGGPYTEITIKVQVSDDNGSTYYDYYSAPCVSEYGEFYIDFVPILASRFNPRIPSTGGVTISNDYCFWYKIVGVYGSVEYVFEDSKFYYSLVDSNSVSRIRKKFLPNKEFPVSVFGSSTVVVDGVSMTYNTTRASAYYVYPSTSLVVDGVTYEPGCGVQLYYINRYGCWDVMLMDGNDYRRDDVSKDLMSGYDMIAYGAPVKVNSPYNIRVVPKIELNTGWMTEEEASIFAQDVLESPVIYVQSDYYGGIVGERCYIDNSSVNYLRNTKDNVMSYNFEVTCGRPIIKY